MTGSATERAHLAASEATAVVADRILDDVAERLPGARAAVLSGASDGPAVVLSLIGAHRAPWPDPRDDDTAVGRVWRGGQALITAWASADGERSVLAVPVEGPDDTRSAVVVADREASHPFDLTDLTAVAEVAHREAAALERSLEAMDLRDRAAHQERVRLAQELHDSMAQELVALGYRLDFTRRQATRSDTESMAGLLDEARDELTRILADLRLKMADLQVEVDPDHGLEAALRPRLEQVAELTGLDVAVEIEDTGLALPARVQDQLFRFVLDLLTDVRHARGATRVELEVRVDAPWARLRFHHDGESSLPSRDFSGHPLADLGAVIFIGHATQPGVELTLELSPADSGDANRHRTERIPLRS